MKHLVLATTILLIACIILTSACQPPKQHNVVWILLDACRTNLGCYGYDRSTSPNIDALAARGVVFDDHYAQSTWTPVSMASYLTGRYFAQRSVGVYGLSLKTVHIRPREEALISEIFRENGYETVMVSPDGPYFSATKPLMRSFDRWFGIQQDGPSYPPFADLNVEALNYLAQDRDRPFFLYIHALDTHFPHDPEPPFDRWLDPNYDASQVEQSPRFGARASGGKLSNADQQYLRGLHDGSIMYADHHIGVLLERMQDLGLLDNTVVIIGADHGDALGEDGETVGHASTHDEVLHVPLVMAGPGIPEGVTVSDLTANVDIVPTLIDLLGLVTEAETHGVSLLPVSEGRAEQAPRQETFHYKTRDWWGLRDEEYKYQLNRRNGAEALYPLRDTVADRVNRIAQQPDIARQMKERMLSEYGPHWDAAQSRDVAFFYFNAASIVGNKKAISPDVQAEHSSGPALLDNKWSASDGQLFSASFSEDAPRLRLKATVRPAPYQLLVEMLCSDDYEGRPASRLRIKVLDESEFRDLTCDAGLTADGDYRFVRVGNYTLGDPRFRIEIDDGGGDEWSIFRSIVLVNDTEKAVTLFADLMSGRSERPEDVQRRMEELRTLGYVE